MQFIPSTWRAWASDGNLDGRADPQQIDDAALAAARYLCAGGRDLATGAGWWAAVLAYNGSVPYGQKVFGLADGYARTTAAQG
jgi:membrane-bound lytic murein transglycosylase B